MSDNQRTGYQPRFVTAEEISQVESLLAEKSGWDATTRAAVKRGKDEIGEYLDFGTPQRGLAGSSRVAAGRPSR